MAVSTKTPDVLTYRKSTRKRGAPSLANVVLFWEVTTRVPQPPDLMLLSPAAEEKQVLPGPTRIRDK